MDIDPPHSTPPQPYAIVRIKRKRHEEPLDALVVDASPSRKKTKGVFQYAGTVEQAEWNDEQQKKQLERHIAGLAREKRREAAPEPVESAAVTPEAATARALAAVAPAKPGPPQYKSPKWPTPNRTYKIVQQEETKEDPYARRRQSNAPPKVWSTKELDAAKKAAQFKMYEAVLSTGDKAIAPTETDAEIEKFLPLLKDYLNLGEFVPPHAPGKGDKDADSMEEDYVYDVFFHRPTTVQDLYHSEAGSNIAKLTNLPPELSGLVGEDDSDEEYSDEDDEDSNAEDWYTNDYPDEEESDRDDDAGSDAFHEDSDSDDMLYPDERDRRAYRDVMADDF